VLPKQKKKKEKVMQPTGILKSVAHAVSTMAFQALTK
jgi:hypothetical protein